jgi:hypothetical protein
MAGNTAWHAVSSREHLIHHDVAGALTVNAIDRGCADRVLRAQPPAQRGGRTGRLSSQRCAALPRRLSAGSSAAPAKSLTQDVASEALGGHSRTLAQGTAVLLGWFS